jgi:predicted outer membrane repeat protein
LDSDGTSNGYNVTNNKLGTVSDSAGYTGTTGDLFEQTDLPVSPVSFNPLAGSAALNVLPVSLPADYPLYDFYGEPIPGGGAAGAVQTPLAVTGHVLRDSVIGAGTVNANPAPTGDGIYIDGSTVTLTAAPAAGTGAQFAYWIVNNTVDTAASLEVTMDGSKTVQAVFRLNNPTVSTEAELRAAINNLSGNPKAQTGKDDSFSFASGVTITLTAPLPSVSKSVTITGNGATLTQNGVTGSLLSIGGGSTTTVTISRLRFLGGRGQYTAGGIVNYGITTLTSCIFDDNQSASVSGNAAQGGALYTEGSSVSLTVKGCTFYNNKVTGTQSYGAAIYRYNGTLTLTGNVFYGNTARYGNVVYNNSGSTTTSGFNVSDMATGNSTAADNVLSGWTFAGTDIQAANLHISPINYKPFAGSPALTRITSRPSGYPTADFSGVTIPTSSAASGAVQTQASGWILTAGVNSDSFGSIHVGGTLNDDGLYANNAVVTLTETPESGKEFAYWLVNGAKTTTSPLSLTMDGNKTVQAVFVRRVAVTDLATLTAALNSTNQTDWDLISLPAATTITLTAVLPDITKSIIIEGNGSLLTKGTGFPAASATSQLLRITAAAATVNISGLHFKGGATTNWGGAIRNDGNLTVESCIFTGNTAGTGNGGAIYTADNRSLTVKGCTFTSNNATRGGAIYGGTGAAIYLTGNLFWNDNQSISGDYGKEVYQSGGVATSYGFNTTNRVGSASTPTQNSSNCGWSAYDSTDKLGLISVTLTFNTTAALGATDYYKPALSATPQNLKQMTALPAGFPATYFDGTPRTSTLPATTGAVKADD